MKYRVTLILAALFVALAAYTYFYEIKGKEKRQEAREKASRALLFESPLVTEIELVTVGQTILLARYGENEWRMKAPVDVRADALVIGGMLTTLEKVQIDRAVRETGGDLLEYGLAQPEVKVKVVMAAQKESLELLIGDESAMGGYVYAKVGDRDAIYLLPAYIRGSLQKTVATLREKRLFPDSSIDKVSRFRLLHVSPPLSLKSNRGAGEKWALEAPHSFPLNVEKGEGLISQVVTLRAEDFPASTPALERALAHPLLRFVWEEEGKKEPVELQIVKEGEKIYAKTSQDRQIYEIASYHFDDLNVGLAALKREEEPKQPEAEK